MDELAPPDAWQRNRAGRAGPRRVTHQEWSKVSSPYELPICSRYGARYLAAILAGGDQVGWSVNCELYPCPPVIRALR